MTLQAVPGIPVGLGGGRPVMSKLIAVGPDFEMAVEFSDHFWQRFCAISRGGHVAKFKPVPLRSPQSQYCSRRETEQKPFHCRLQKRTSKEQGPE
jgi:hypothetical protein